MSHLCFWRRRPVFFLSVLALVVASLAATAQVTMVSSLGEPRRNSDPVAVDSWIADKFTTSASVGGFDLTSVVIQMSAADVDAGNYFAAVYSDDCGLPGAPIGSPLIGSSAPGAAAQYTFTASGIHLNATTSYWLLEGVSSGSSIYNPDYEITTPSITDIWTITGVYTSSEDAAATWAEVGADGPVMYSLQAKAVPEPADFGLMGGAVCLVMGAWVRRRR